jgi:molybdate transport system substrate-binding protein
MTSRSGIRVTAAAILMMAAGLLFGPRLQSPDQSPLPPPAPLPLQIAAASDLRFALEELTTGYRRTSLMVSPVVTYGSSGTLYAQILSGAPFDLFLSADTDYPMQLATHGLTVAGSEFTYAIGRLAVWVPAASSLDVEKSGLQVLIDPRVMHVAMANPATAPYGRAAEDAMRRAAVYERARTKIVLGENVAQALQFVQSGAADVGVIAMSLAVAPTVGGTGRYWPVPLDLYPRLDQGGVILKTDAIDQARDFRRYLLSETGRGVLKRYGFYGSDN